MQPKKWRLFSATPTSNRLLHNAEEARAFVEIAYQLAFQRSPDPDGLEHYSTALVQGRMSCTDLLNVLAQSAEARQRIDIHALVDANEVLDTPTCDPEFCRELRMQRPLQRTCFDKLLQDILDQQRLIVGQQEYLPQHRERFWELFNAAAWLLKDTPSPRLLEFGVSEFSALYQVLVPGVRLDLADRPTPPDYIGFTEAVARNRTTCENYYTVDLQGGNHALSAAGIPSNQYDLVIFAETLEHLIINPQDLLPGMLALLNDSGLLYLTTPNYLRSDNRRKIAHGNNPQDIYPRGDGNWDLHYHHREYTAPELIKLIEASGGVLKGFYYSNCWDHDPELPETERANMVFVIARGRNA